MSAATGQINVPDEIVAYIMYPIAASTKIFGGVAVCVNAAGYLVNAADTSGLIFKGFAAQSSNAFDNTSGSNGALSVPVIPLFQGQGYKLLTCVNATQAWVGTHVFWLDNQTVGQAGSSSNKVIAGTVEQVISPTQVLVNIKDRSALANS